MNVPPWLEHLRRDRRGIPVPYVNRWGTEDAAHLRIAYDPNVGMPAVFSDDYGDVPDFTRQHMSRQRECVARLLCQVCGRFVPRRFLTLVGADLAARRVDVGWGETVLFHEPWLHERCAAFAVEHCPALIRRAKDENLVLLPMAGMRWRTVLSTGVIDGPLHEESERVRPAMWAKVEVLGPR